MKVFCLFIHVLLDWIFEIFFFFFHAVLGDKFYGHKLLNFERLGFFSLYLEIFGSIVIDCLFV